MRCILLLCFFIMACKPLGKHPVERVLNSKNSKIKNVVSNLAKHEVQILFSEVVREKEAVTFRDYGFQVNDSSYFYPASAVKFPIAILALEKLNENATINRNTRFNLEKDTLKTTFAIEIEKLFAVSDNEAYNRLFEYLGADYINKTLFEKGINARISHRLSTPNSANLITKKLFFFNNKDTVYISNPIGNQPIKALTLNKISKGIGYMKNGSLINEAMDFSFMNYLSITALHQIMKQLMFPESFPKSKQFHLANSDRSFLIKSMAMLPKEAGYTSNEYHDSYVKFLVFGDSKKPIPEHIKIYNKVGYAYGYLTDCAYIVNEKTKKEYIITATLHVNENKIFNDNNYEYETIGFPFLAELGKQLID